MYVTGDEVDSQINKLINELINELVNKPVEMTRLQQQNSKKSGSEAVWQFTSHCSKA